MNELNIVCKDYSKECVMHEFKMLRKTLENKRNIRLGASKTAESNGDFDDATVLHNQWIIYDKFIKELDLYMENMVDDEMEKTFKL